MSISNVNFVISITLLAIIVDTTALECIKETPCSCHFLDGSHYDLNKLGERTVNKFSLFPNMWHYLDYAHVISDGNASAGKYCCILSVTESNYTSSFQPCKNVKIDLGDKTANECTEGAGVSFCVRHQQEKPFSLGNTTETKWNLPSAEPELILKHGAITTRVTLICCAVCNSSKLNLDTKTDATKFHYTLTSPWACKMAGPVEGISTGSLLVILLFVFSGVYLLVGALTLRFFRGAIGWELIPNYDFWSDLPALVRDGVAFTFSGCSADSYDRI